MHDIFLTATMLMIAALLAKDVFEAVMLALAENSYTTTRPMPVYSQSYGREADYEASAGRAAMMIR